MIAECIAVIALIRWDMPDDRPIRAAAEPEAALLPLQIRLILWSVGLAIGASIDVALLQLISG